MPQLVSALLPAVFALGIVGPVSGEEDKRPGKGQPDGREDRARAAEIDRLIAQLGDADFARREAAVKALKAIGRPALAALRKAAAESGDVEIRRRAQDLTRAIENRLDSQLAEYHALGLPLPPSGASLVRFQIDRGNNVPGDEKSAVHGLAFLLRPGNRRVPATLLWGSREFRPARSLELKVLNPQGASPEDLGLWVRDAVQSGDSLVLAIQCKSRGWDSLADALFEASLRTGVPLLTGLAKAAWGHYDQELCRPGTDRAGIARQMKALLAAEKELDTADNRMLLHSLEAALVPSRAKPGTVEALIDDLVELTGHGGLGEFEDTDPRYLRLLHQGFDAVPALIEHLDDDRLTRGTRPRSHGSVSYHLRVRHVVSDLLQGLAGPTPVTDVFSRAEDRVVEKKEAVEWWEAARKYGEEAYLLTHALPAGAPFSIPNPHVLLVIGRKYPRHLPRLYQAVRDRRPLQARPVVRAIAYSSLPEVEKINYFLTTGEGDYSPHVRLALAEFHRVSSEAASRLFVAALDRFPRTPKEPYWRCREVAIARFVLISDDPRPWQALEQTAERSDVGLRMEFLDLMDMYLEEGSREKRLAFLAAFLDDAAVRDVRARPDLFVGGFAGHRFPRLEVRNVAAMQIAAVVRMPVQVELNWTPEQWEHLRRRAREALAERPKE